MTVSPWCVRSLGIRRATGGSGGAPAGWPGGVAATVEASARVGLLLIRAVYGRHRPGLPWPRPSGRKLDDHGIWYSGGWRNKSPDTRRLVITWTSAFHDHGRSLPVLRQSR